METPLPSGDYAISIASGFWKETFEGNRIDSRGSAAAANLVLVGNHFGTRIVGNHFLGGGGSWKLAACPTESPVHWGWSHAPFLGIVMERNIIEDPVQGSTIAVEHGTTAKSNRGRVYLSMTFQDNVARFTGPFLASQKRKVAPAGFTIGGEHAARSGRAGPDRAAGPALKRPRAGRSPLAGSLRASQRTR